MGTANAASTNGRPAPEHSLGGVLLPEVFVLVGGDLLQHVEGFAHELFLDDFDEFVLLQRLARHVEGQVVRVHDALQQRRRELRSRARWRPPGTK